jgi:hypothetical protein
MFKHPEHDIHFKQKGFCSFRLLSAQQIQELKAIYRHFEEAHNRSEEKFRGTGWINDYRIADEVNRAVATVVEPALNEYFLHHQILGYNFLLKSCGADSAVPLHQDWTYVDEQLYFSMNVWIALEDTDLRNGCLMVVPCSHHIFGHYLRPSPAYPVPFRNIRPWLAAFARKIPLRAGECVCFDNRTVHGSFPNLTPSNRLALVTTLYPAQAKLLHHYVHNPQRPEEITTYELTAKDFFKIKRGAPPASYVHKTTNRTTYPHFSAFDFLLSQWKLYFSK